MFPDTPYHVQGTGFSPGPAQYRDENALQTGTRTCSSFENHSNANSTSRKNREGASFRVGKSTRNLVIP